MAQTVVLLHQQHAKPDHYDWLIDQPDLGTEKRLICFRIPVRPDQHTDFFAEKTPDHRAIYLTYEGQLTGNRGTVRRVATGQAYDLRIEKDRLYCCLEWSNSRFDCTAVRSDASLNRWRFQLRPQDPG